MLLYLSEAAIAARKRANRKIEPVAALADVSSAVLYRFERGESWPNKLDSVIAAYADVGGLADARDLWQAGLDLWHEHEYTEQASHDGELTRPQRAEAIIRGHVARDRKRAERASAGTSKTTRKRKAGL